MFERIFEDMDNLFDISGKVVVVTGACGVLGKPICRYFAGAGARVAILAREHSRQEAQQMVEEIGADGGEALFLPTDVLDEGLLEQNHHVKSQEYQEQKFISYCEMITKTFKNIYFLEGRRKYDWKQLYNTGFGTPHVTHCYSSTTSMFGSNKDKWYAKIDDFWPWLYAQLRNSKNYAENISKDTFLMLDFI